MRWEASLLDYDGDERRVTDLKELIRRGKWVGKNTSSGFMYYPPEGHRRSLLPLALRENEHFFAGESAGDKEQNLLKYVNAKIRDFKQGPMDEPEEPLASSCVVMSITELKHGGGYLYWPALLMTPEELDEFLDETLEVYDARRDVGVKLLCFKGHQVRILVERAKVVRVTPDDLKEMMELWQEVVVNGNKAAEQHVGRKLRKDQLKPIFLAGLAFALAFANRGKRVGLDAPVMNDGTVDHFAPEVLINPWDDTPGEGVSDEQLAAAFPELMHCEVQTADRVWTECEQRCSHVALALWYLKKDGIELPPEALAPPPSPSETNGKRKAGEGDTSGDEGSTSDSGGSTSSASPAKRPRTSSGAGSDDDELTASVPTDAAPGDDAAQPASDGTSSGGGGAASLAGSGTQNASRASLPEPNDVIDLSNDDDDDMDEEQQQQQPGGVNLSTVKVEQVEEAEEEGEDEEEEEDVDEEAAASVEKEHAEMEVDADGDATGEGSADEVEGVVGEAAEMDVVREERGMAQEDTLRQQQRQQEEEEGEEDKEEERQQQQQQQQQQQPSVEWPAGNAVSCQVPTSPTPSSPVLDAAQSPELQPMPRPLPLPASPPAEVLMMEEDQRQQESREEEDGEEVDKGAVYQQSRSQSAVLLPVQPEQAPEQQNGPPSPMHVEAEPPAILRKEGVQQSDAVTATEGGAVEEEEEQGGVGAAEDAVQQDEPQLQRSCRRTLKGLNTMLRLVDEEPSIEEGVKIKVEVWASSLRLLLERILKVGPGWTNHDIMEDANQHMFKAIDAAAKGLLNLIPSSEKELQRSTDEFWKFAKQKVKLPEKLEQNRQHTTRTEEEILFHLVKKRACVSSVDDEESQPERESNAIEKKVQDFQALLSHLSDDSPARPDIERLLEASKADLVPLKGKADEAKKFRLIMGKLRPLLQDCLRARQHFKRASEWQHSAEDAITVLKAEWPLIRVLVRQALLGEHNKTLALTDQRCARHIVPLQHPEQPARLELAALAIKMLSLHLPGIFRAEMQISANNPYHPVFNGYRYIRELLNVHNFAYLEEIRKHCLSLGNSCAKLDQCDTYGSEQTIEAASVAVAAALQAVDDVMQGKANNAFVACRPPGHHAGCSGQPNLSGAVTSKRSSSRCTASSSNDVGQGFCVLNSAAVAAKHARTRWGLNRVTVIDIDLHHGNGTEEILCGNGGISKDYQYVSIHCTGLYPFTGEADPSRHPYVVNLPISGNVDATAFRTMADKAEGLIEQFRPDLIIISAGFDAHRNDPIRDDKSTQRGFLDAVDYYDLGRRMRRVAEQLCAGRLVAVMEGGYTIKSVAPEAETIRHCVSALAQGMAGLAEYDRAIV